MRLGQMIASMTDAEFALFSIGIGLGLFATMLLLLDVGRRLGVRQAEKLGVGARLGAGLVDSAVYGLLALLMGFTFSGAAGRFDERRHLVADEVNIASTAWKRIALVPADNQTAIRDAFRAYIDALHSWYGSNGDTGGGEMFYEPVLVSRAEDALWSRAVAACLTSTGEHARMLLLPSLNDLFGVVEKERLSRRLHPPLVIWGMLGIMALMAALLAGYGLANGRTRNWIYMIGLTASVSAAIYVIIELEYPRIGLFRVTAIDQALVEFRATLN